MTTWPSGVSGLCYGGDYNPEQWPEQVWDSDVKRMREAGVNLVSVAVFAWALLEPEPGTYRFDWLDRVLERLDGAGIRVDLATATASPPPWLSARHPEILPVDRDGRRAWPGGRQAFCPSSPVYRERALALVEQLANRYRGHPALAMWHAGNEYGGHNAYCYCDVSAAAFRTWLERRYGTVDALNQAWGTAFWSQRYGDWDQVLPPRHTLTFGNPTQALDFRRFSSDELLDNFRAERDLLHRLAPGVPVTTNFMVIRFFDKADYWAWGPEVDLVANDHYLDAADPAAHVELALCADITRGLAAGEPWLLLEHATSAVNWQPRNLAKLPGQLRRNSLQHVARGADGVCFFQWRASRAGAEKYHSAMLPHTGTDTKVWREVTGLGATLGALAEVRGTRVVADAALVWDWQAWWACDLDAHPSVEVRYLDQVHALYRALWELGVTVDVVAPGADLSPYRLAFVPALYLVTDAAAESIRRWVSNGGHAVVTFFSGIVDQHDHVRLGGYPGAFRDLLGVRTEEFFPLAEGERVGIDGGGTATVWTELLHLDGAETVASYTGGPLPGVPAVTRNRYGAGLAWYLATRLDGASTVRLLRMACGEAGVAAGGAPPGVELVRRAGGGRSYLFALNHNGDPATVHADGVDLVGGGTVSGALTVPPGGVAVIREDPGRDRAPGQGA
jgi:beta-galactosidase